MTSDNITVDGNILFHFPIRSLIIMDSFVDPSAALMVCGYNYPDVCSKMTITNNIVAGSFYCGIASLARVCDDTSDLSFFNNVAHSVKGNGAFVYPDLNNQNILTCFEANNYTAYKNTEAGIISYEFSANINYNNMILIDNGYGFTVMNGGSDGDNMWIKTNNIKMYGET